MEEELPYNGENTVITLEEIQSILGPHHTATSPELFQCAMVHRSYCVRKNESLVSGNKQCPANCLPLQGVSNERLEFLGDAVVGLVVGSYLYERYPDQNEGFLTMLRTKLVCGEMLARLCQHIGLKKYFIISKQLEHQRESTKILEDMFEAFIGALYIDSGRLLETPRAFLVDLIETHIDFPELIKNRENPKMTLIKKFHALYGKAPEFRQINQEFKDGKRSFTVSLLDTNQKELIRASGTSRKRAEMKCAELYLAKF